MTIEPEEKFPCIALNNVLTKGSVLTDNLFIQRVWPWTQCIAIDASVAGTIIRTFRYPTEGEKIKTWLYGLLSALLLFTAAIVLNIESVQQRVCQVKWLSRICSAQQ